MAIRAESACATSCWRRVSAADREAGAEEAARADWKLATGPAAASRRSWQVGVWFCEQSIPVGPSRIWQLVQAIIVWPAARTELTYATASTCLEETMLGTTVSVHVRPARPNR